jgi:ABC-type polysaccharide/polyol phosphate export permease
MNTFNYIIKGIGEFELWTRLASTELKRRYRRTIIGPFWTSLNLAIFVLSMGFLYSKLWGQDPNSYLPYLCSGMISWSLISSFFTDGSSVYTSNSSLLTQIRVNLFTLVSVVIYRNLIIYTHNLSIFAILILFTSSNLNIYSLLIIPGLLILIINGFWIVGITGMLCSRYRDITPIIVNLLQISLFLTPIFWAPDQISGRSYINILIDYNPLFQFVSIIRFPMLGMCPSTWTYLYTITVGLIGNIFMFFLYKRMQQRIIFWL